MKTIKDVIEAYPDGWSDDANNLNAIGYNSRDDLFFTCLIPMYEFINRHEYFVCTREEYEQALKESKMETQMMFNGQKVNVLFNAGEQSVIEYKNGNKDFVFNENLSAYNKTKTVSLDWLVGSGIDCEFSDIGKWRLGKLDEISRSEYKFKDVTGDGWIRCRPRMNQPMALTNDQLDLIPKGFDFQFSGVWNFEGVMKGGIYTFKGLKDGYKYEWEE